MERTVLVTPVRLANGATQRYSGTLQAVDRSDLAFENSGAIRAIHVDLGDSIVPGQLLAELDDEAFRLDLRVQKANLENAKVDLRDARLDYERLEVLAGSGASSRSAVDQARARLDRAQAQVDAFRAQVAQSEKRLADTRLTASFAGEISARFAEASEYVGAGQPVLRAVGENHRLEAILHIPGDAYRDLETGQSVRLSVPGQESSAQGTVSSIGTEANRAGLFPFTVRIAENRLGLRPGGSIEVTWESTAEGQHLLIPLTAYVPVGKGMGRVFVIDQQDGNARVVARDVTLGDLRTHGIEIRSGLEPGELVVRKGADLLQDGERVRTAGVGLARYNR